ncbi:YfhD family protein [Paenibacillus hodogayensis]|uniref:YfhD family protein n=1 Tax=Paenibacillus hodogayensis TaxID=279208 RepID=A0ABV5VQS7_9BACL
MSFVNESNSNHNDTDNEWAKNEDVEFSEALADEDDREAAERAAAADERQHND